MSRYLAFFYHFLISLGIFAVIAYLILYQWYPDFFFSIDGGWEGMRIIIGVDLVLGPLLTLIVFKSGKPGLKFDLVAIGTLQAVCLAIGTYIVYIERPLFFIFDQGHFYSSSKDTFTNFGAQVPDHRRWEKIPARVFVRMPDDPIEEADLRGELYRQGIPTWTHSPLYESLEANMDLVMENGSAESELRAYDTENQLDNWLQEVGGTFAEYAFFPIHSRYRSTYMAIRRTDRAIMKLLEVSAPIVPQ